jgi:hypothetical protein
MNRVEGDTNAYDFKVNMSVFPCLHKVLITAHAFTNFPLCIQIFLPLVHAFIRKINMGYSLWFHISGGRPRLRSTEERHWSWRWLWGGGGRKEEVAVDVIVCLTRVLRRDPIASRWWAMGDGKVVGDGGWARGVRGVAMLKTEEEDDVMLGRGPEALLGC